MPPSPIPAPLPPWARALLQIAPFIPAGLQFALDFIGELHPSSSASVSQWRRCVALAHIPGDPDNANTVATSFDIMNITNGNPDNTWNDADYTTAQTQVAAMLSAWAGEMSAPWTWFETRWYVMAFTALGTLNPITQKDQPFEKSGEPERIYAVNLPGAGPIQAAQVSMTSTEKTVYPKHWGRNYWPVPSSTSLDPNGRFKAAVVTAFGTSLGAAYDALQAAELFPVVPVVQIGKQPARALLTVTSLQVDNTPDIQRRRRVHRPDFKYVHPTS